MQCPQKNDKTNRPPVTPSGLSDFGFFTSPINQLKYIKTHSDQQLSNKIKLLVLIYTA